MMLSVRRQSGFQSWPWVASCSALSPTSPAASSYGCPPRPGRWRNLLDDRAGRPPPDHCPVPLGRQSLRVRELRDRTRRQETPGTWL